MLVDLDRKNKNNRQIMMHRSCFKHKFGRLEFLSFACMNLFIYLYRMYHIDIDFEVIFPRIIHLRILIYLV